MVVNKKNGTQNEDQTLNEFNLPFYESENIQIMMKLILEMRLLGITILSLTIS